MHGVLGCLYKLKNSVLMKELLILFLVVGALAVPKPKTAAGGKCGYNSCTAPKAGMLNVHIVPHTHDDVGWLKTVDQYYYGSRNDIQKAGVQYILDSVVKKLWEKPERRFIYVETAFFWKWWELQSKEVRDKVHVLVEEGRLKFAGGAWSMNDEAATYYQTTIDQFSWGLSKLDETFGKCGRPAVGWQIDPFGHSREFASLLAQMGYDGLFLGRIDYEDKLTRLKDKTMEMVWRGDDALGGLTDIFTSVMYNTYSPPPGFCFDVLCQDEPIIDDPGSPDYNVDRRVYQFLRYMKQTETNYRTNNIIITMGGDFTYMQAGMWYENLDKLIQYGNLKAVNEDLNITMFYSTPDCYLKAVNDAKPSLPLKQDDFFPYASDPHSFWTGYFTSRPTVKYLEAQTNTFLQTVKQLQVLAQLSKDFLPRIDELKSVMGVMQHHDAVTGTEKQHVARDYVRMVTAAVDAAHHVPSAALNKALKPSAGLGSLSFDRCHFNESSCHTAENSNGSFMVAVYNPLAWEVTTPVSIPVVGGSYQCLDGNGNHLTVQMSDIPDAVLNIPNRDSKATKEVTFIADLPALGFKSFYLSLVKRNNRDARSVHYKPIDIEEYFNKIKQAYTDVRNFNELGIIVEDSKGKKAVFNEFDNDVIKFVPDVPVVDENKFKVKPDSKAKLLLKTKDVIDKNVEEFGRLFDSVHVGPKRSRHVENPYSNMDDMEMRMLGDDPMVVTRYPDDEMADQSPQTRSGSTSDEILHSLNIEPMYYRGVIGNNQVFTNRSSGAYIFRPDSAQPTKLDVQTTVQITGNVFDETRQTLSKNVAFNKRRYKNDKIKYTEIDWLVGPIPIEDGAGKEFIIKYDSNIINNGEFYTDSNGRQILKRILDKRPQWNLTLYEPVSGNYYPITSAIGIRSEDGCSMTVLPDRAVGGSSLEEGSIEVMVHRRLLHDDAFGVGEPLNETVDGKGLVARGLHRLFMCENVTFKEVLEMRLRPQIFVADVKNLDLNNWKGLGTEFSWLKAPLPDGVHLLTIEHWGEKKLLLRLENVKDDTVEVDLSNILKGVDVKSFVETMLSGTFVEDRIRMTWDKDGEFADDFNKEYGREFRPRARQQEREADDGFKIHIADKEIRTFIVTYEPVDF